MPIREFFEFSHITEVGSVRFRSGGYTREQRRELFELWKVSHPEIVAEARHRKEQHMLTFNMMDAKVVIAVFTTNPEKEYAYFVPDGDAPEVGDVILTSTNWDTFQPPKPAAAQAAKRGKLHSADPEALLRTWDEEEPVKLMGADVYTAVALDAKLARIIDVTAAGHPQASRFYMKLISVRDLRATHEMNQSMALRAKEVREAYAQLDKMMEKENRNDMYRRLAERNPDAQRLLAKIEGTDAK